ncbi:UNVERIFIED_CONTAM: Trans-resveratrol di-O-methyltransferase [Sesamum radiatum]|uniref:Trans-resveratrol di-O-methyltransferase n=1 Tax=Sesamum radiatum TaxID=300843 RepID=A0AAW2S8M1_SESRA
MIKQERSSELLEAEAHIWNQVLIYINSMSLKCAAELGIPEIIHKHGRPMTLTELVDALLASIEPKPTMYTVSCGPLCTPAFLYWKKWIHLMNRLFAYSCFTSFDGDHSMSMKAFVLSQLDSTLTGPWQHLSGWFQNNEHRTAFHATHGMSLWEQKEHNPRFGHLFDQGMGNDATIVANVITRDCREVFEGLGSLVDVGGGTGTLAKAIAVAHPQIHCTVLDLAPVVAGLEGTRNLKYMEGDMFRFIPSSDAVLLKWIMHDWSDEECVQILKKCKEALTSNQRAKVIIIEKVVDDHKSDHKSV